MLGEDTSLRYNVLSKKIICYPDHLLPTESSTKYHCQRVDYQIMVWAEMGSDMNPVDWGWKLEDNQFVPVMTNKAAAPERLLQMIHCNCTTPCQTSKANNVVADDTKCLACLLVDCVRMIIVNICINNFYGTNVTTSLLQAINKFFLQWTNLKSLFFKYNLQHEMMLWNQPFL